MIIIFTFIITITKALISTTSTCSYVPQSSGSIDIRQEILNLGPNSTIADLDTTSICNNYGNQDFLTLLQIWIPSKYNFYNKTNPTKANDYRELYNIKEYLFDPALGTLTQLYQFLNSLKDQCPHLKILGEFSFHIGQDSYLLQNVSRFLRRPSNANPNIQNPRYDQKGFVWARNDIGKRIPGSAVWNIFDPTALSDIYQIQLTLLSQHQLDGISFIYPSLGLYQIANQFYGPEISAYGTITQDFYQSWATTSIAKNCFNVGLFDSSLQKYKLFSSYLQYVSSFNAYTQPRFFDVNHTFDLVNSSSLYTKEPNSIVLNTEGDTKLAFIVTQVNTTQPTCIKFNISVFYHIMQSYNDSLPGNIIVGMANLEGAVVNNFDANVQIRLFAVNSSSQKIIFKLDTSINGTQGFSIPPNSQLELQYNANTKNFIIKILGKQTAYKSFMIDYTKLTMNMTNLRYTAGTNITGLNISISFPYYFSKDSPNWQNLGDRNIELKDNPYSSHQFAIIEPSIHYLNQIQILNVRQQSTSIICIGAAAKYVIKQKNYQCNFNQLGCGAYLICSNGFTFHNSDSTINNKAQTITFSKSNIMSLYYQDSDYSLTVYKDSVLFYKFIMDRTNKMRVLNFCVASITPGGSLSLEY